jgi:hypothetical protein
MRQSIFVSSCSLFVGCASTGLAQVYLVNTVSGLAGNPGYTDANGANVRFDAPSAVTPVTRLHVFDS